MYYSSFPYGFTYPQQAFIPVQPGYIAMPTPAPQNRGTQFPPVNIRKFDVSAHRFKEVMDQANRFIGALIASDDFARRLMDAAQQSNQREVERLVRSTGVTIKYQINYTPDGLRIDFTNRDAEHSCCTLRMALNW
ncbi:hypothetical protein MHZ92_18040 [Sporosarcina sp. ACRSL]|uniref:hypothetical protein n=1 Tax=Sporosarcina sp. ACRSL TaxID=2918215 RepID=UPI001EF4720B|nr:hypothetical protein [Sporosarcina sp. ACRSL]MCG7346017.1 hypothetical protein [Sporosarcina sp. ACRSL]